MFLHLALSLSSLYRSLPSLSLPPVVESRFCSRSFPSLSRASLFLPPASAASAAAAAAAFSLPWLSRALLPRLSLTTGLSVPTRAIRSYRVRSRVSSLPIPLPLTCRRFSSSFFSLLVSFASRQLTFHARQCPGLRGIFSDNGVARQKGKLLGSFGKYTQAR